MSNKKGHSKKKNGTKAIGSSSNQKSRTRYQVKVLLDVDKDNELMLLESIDELKRKRRWLPTFRNALRLFFSLCEGHTDVLRELFPAVIDGIETNAALSKEVREMMALLSDAARKTEHYSPVMVQVSPPKPIRDMDYEPPTLDDFNDQPTQVASTVDIAANFMNSMMGMLG